MSKKTLSGVALVVVILAVIGIIVGVMVWRNRRHLATLTAEASAEILNVDVINNNSNRRSFSSNRQRRSGGSTHTAIDYRYVVGGRTLMATTEKGGDVHNQYKVGRPAKVCYNPSNPEDSEVFLPDYKCGR